MNELLLRAGAWEQVTPESAGWRYLHFGVRSGSFAQIGSTPDVDRGNPVVGTGGPRAMQWALKVLF